MGEDLTQVQPNMEIPEIPDNPELTDLPKAGLSINMEGLKETLINFLVPLVSIGIIGGLVMILALPTFKSLPELNAEYKANNDKIAILKGKVSKLKEIQKYQGVIDENSELVNKVLVSEEDVPRVSEQIRQISLNSGFTITRLNYSTATGAAPRGVEDTAALQNVTPLTRISLGTEGVYGQIIAFLQGLEDAAQLVTVDSFRFALANTSDTTGLLSTSFSLEAPYLFVESNAVTDEAVNLNLNDPEFARIMGELKEYRYYEFSVEELVAAEERLDGAETEEVVEEAIDEEELLLPEDETEIVDPVIVVPPGAVSE